MQFKLFFVLLICSLFSLSSNAQKIWLDKDLKATQKTKASFYKVASGEETAVSYFYKSGAIYRKLNYFKGKLEGKFSEFYETGELKIAGRYKNNLKTDVWKTYTKKGKIREKGKYKKGKKTGVWKTFYKNEK